jgi:hypothetical protein
MAAKGKNGKKSGKKSGKAKDGDRPGESLVERVIEFTPEGVFNIRLAAPHFARLMDQSGQSLIIHLPHVSIEFETGCTPREIIEGFNQAMQSHVVIKPSNANVKGGKKP